MKAKQLGARNHVVMLKRENAVLWVKHVLNWIGFFFVCLFNGTVFMLKFMLKKLLYIVPTNLA